MKKLLLITTISLISAVSSNAASCANGTLASQTGPCTFTDAGKTWTISNFALNGSTDQGYPGNAQTTTSDIFVSFIPMSTFSYSGLVLPGSIAGVFVRFSYASGAANNFFQATNAPAVDQNAAFQVSYDFLDAANSSLNAFTNAFGIVDGFNTKNCTSLTGGICAADSGGFRFGGTNVSKNYAATRGGTPLLSLTPTQTVAFDGHVDVGTLSPASYYAIEDNYQLKVGSGSTPFATQSINYFGNGQYVNTTPEPVTFAMIGFGLLGVGLLRRIRG